MLGNGFERYKKERNKVQRLKSTQDFQKPVFAQHKLLHQLDADFRNTYDSTHKLVYILESRIERVTLEEVDALLKKGADVNEIEIGGSAIEVYLTEMGREDILKLMFAHDSEDLLPMSKE